MFIGHLPAGYLAACYLWCRCEALRGVEWKYLVAAALLGSVFPDLDWFYFYFVDHRRHHHHTYWTHLPIFWVLAIPIALLPLRAARTPRAFALAAIFGGSAFVHLLLDSIVGQIWWPYPWGGRAVLAVRGQRRLPAMVAQLLPALVLPAGSRAARSRNVRVCEYPQPSALGELNCRQTERATRDSSSRVSRLQCVTS
jgi:inner membrane protein